MRHYGIHPAAGVGAFIPGFFYSPENPVQAGARGYAHYVPDARLRIASSNGAPASALAKSLDQAGAFTGSAYGVGCLGGCSCNGGAADYNEGEVSVNGGQVDFNGGAEPGAFMGNGGLPTWAHIAIGASLAGLVVSVLGIRQRRPRNSTKR